MNNNTSIQQDVIKKKLILPRRRFLVKATAVLAAVGAVLVSIPFVKSLMPSERAKTSAAPILFDLSKLEPGKQVTVPWQSKPVFILKRTPKMLQALNQPSHLSFLRDPDSKVESQQPAYINKSMRSLRDEYFIAVGLCTHLGCIPTFRPEFAPNDLGTQWVGGYYCPCHGSRYDLAGRVYKGVPAPTNLVIPPYHYLSDTVIEIGIDPVV